VSHASDASEIGDRGRQEDVATSDATPECREVEVVRLLGRDHHVAEHDERYEGLFVWVAAFARSPLPPALPLIGAGALLVSGLVLLLAILWSIMAFSEWVYLALLTRPSLGEWRVALWTLALVGYALVMVVLPVGLLFALASM